tara:strand:+ start:1087 stop:1239 length:153 start_codon:yes stop_codon:yes gene_type:complete
MSDALDKDELPSWWAMSTPMGQVGVNTTTEQKRKAEKLKEQRAKSLNKAR